MNQIKGLYAFQEITEEKELLAAFRMRYQTYQEQPDLCVLTPENAANVDIDAYDIYARHFGLFKMHSEYNRELIGYVRLIEIRKNQEIESIIRKIENLFHLTPAYRSHSFYFQRNFLNAQHIIGFFSNKNLKWHSTNLKNISSFKSHIGLISQDSHLFSESLAFNVTLSTDYDEDDFSQFWQQMRDRFKYLRTWGIEGGDKIDIDSISLGQKQIISALRVCYQNKPVILFDEISSSLDTACEEALRGIIKLKQQDSIVWVVTHRVESVMEATKILLMDEGKIVGQGTHDQLLRTSNLYSQFLAELK